MEKHVSVSESPHSEFKKRINDLLRLNKDLIDAVDKFYDTFDDNDLNYVRTCYMRIVALILTQVT
jgi:hypothetical protein